jgi:hypothetical protein
MNVCSSCYSLARFVWFRHWSVCVSDADRTRDRHRSLDRRRAAVDVALVVQVQAQMDSVRNDRCVWNWPDQVCLE